jgi:hypothetical protein
LSIVICSQTANRPSDRESGLVSERYWQSVMGTELSSKRVMGFEMDFISCVRFWNDAVLLSVSHTEATKESSNSKKKKKPEKKKPKKMKKIGKRKLN